MSGQGIPVCLMNTNMKVLYFAFTVLIQYHLVRQFVSQRILWTVTTITWELGRASTVTGLIVFSQPLLTSSLSPRQHNFLHKISLGSRFYGYSKPLFNPTYWNKKKKKKNIFTFWSLRQKYTYCSFVCVPWSTRDGFALLVWSWRRHPVGCLPLLRKTQNRFKNQVKFLEKKNYCPR